MAGLARVLAVLLVFSAVPAATVQTSPSVGSRTETAAGRFEAGALSPDERRVLQAALAFEGGFDGPIDGSWTPESAAALARYARREFGGAAGDVQVAALVISLLAEVETHGWRVRYLPDLDLSVALPEAVFGAPEDEDGGQRWWAEEGALTLLAHDFDAGFAAAWHRAARGANTEAAALEAEDGPDRRWSAGQLEDGRRFETLSLAHGDRWATLYVAGTEADAPLMHFLLASAVGGAAPEWQMPVGGPLEALVRRTLAEFSGAGPLEDFFPPEPARLSPPEATAAASGTGFYVGAHVLLTADHVVANCRRVELPNGTELSLLAADSDLDVAALGTPEAAPAWLALSGDARARLGQKVHAAGYPYYNIAGTSLHLTGGNVSSLADVNDDRRFFSFSAPVQPGSSGGPLIDADGGVMGLVVSRLSERYIAEATGTIPQNINYGLDHAELVSFLERNAIVTGEMELSPGGIGRFDMERGAPDALEGAVVPVFCD